MGSFGPSESADGCFSIQQRSIAFWREAGKMSDSSADLWARIEQVLLEHYHDPDLQAARAVYASVAAHTLKGPPVWPMAVAPPGSMKTDLLAALDGLTHIHLIDRVTPNTFLSGQIKDGKRSSAASSSSLLHRIGASGIIVSPDFGTILSMNRDHRGSVLADMRRIYDGHLRKEYGTDDARTEHEWRGRITLAVAATDEIDSYYSVLQPLGERFVMIRWHRPGGTEAALKAMNQERQRGKDALREAVHALFGALPEIEPAISAATQEQIASLAEFAVRGRTHIPRVGNSKEIVHIPEPESATRLAQQLAQLTKGAALLSGRDAANSEDIALTRRVAFDCIPTLRRTIIGFLIASQDLNEINLPVSTVSYTFEDLELVGLGLKKNGWGLSPFAKQLLETAGVIPSQSVPPSKGIDFFQLMRERGHRVKGPTGLYTS